MLMCRMTKFGAIPDLLIKMKILPDFFSFTFLPFSEISIQRCDVRTCVRYSIYSTRLRSASSSSACQCIQCLLVLVLLYIL